MRPRLLRRVIHKDRGRLTEVLDRDMTGVGESRIKRTSTD